MAKPLSDDQITDELSELSGWSHKNDKLTKEFGFDNFRDAIAFINRIAFEAEEQVHHPEIFNVYNTVNISLSTHDAGGKVTEKDVKLAKTIESLFNN
ncbi:4a-hydroxytetrahydrobiopterin dehydratase [Aliifodinibius salipaludis]|uniref:Putative pterin-4-alpha-carbinolamine dehydratase n=1 Tax=Fodinibius salipaludis TaxID=2032627 RepID=A0A2A2G7N5_9BACT|nr:4a-hydroxytetrahydrobiopterin dehydratase [Aliifodinibius salipaludis]PAU93130.1 4a-hydroxytetrahydrobiopterin dehydratase [Aliifodinibius salipaludis]